MQLSKLVFGQDMKTKNNDKKLRISSFAFVSSGWRQATDAIWTIYESFRPRAIWVSEEKCFPFPKKIARNTLSTTKQPTNLWCSPQFGLFGKGLKCCLLTEARSQHFLHSCIVTSPTFPLPHPQLPLATEKSSPRNSPKTEWLSKWESIQSGCFRTGLP